MPDPKPQLQTTVAVHNALHSFKQAPTLEEIKAKAQEMQRTGNWEEAQQFFRLAVAISPAVSQEQRQAVNQVRENVKAKQRGYEPVPVTVPATKRKPSALGEIVVTGDGGGGESVAGDPDIGPDAPAEQLGTMQAEEERLLARARSGGAAPAAPGPGGGPAAEPRQRTPMQAGMLGIGPTNPIGGRKGTTVVDPPSAPRRGVTIKRQPESAARGPGGSGTGTGSADSNGASDKAGEETSLLDKAKEVIRKLRGDDGLSDPEQDAINRERENEFRNPPERYQTYEL